MITPRAAVMRARRAVHGGRHAQATGDVVVAHDFSACLNVFGPADVVAQAICDAAYREYPDPDSTVARTAAASRWRRSVDEIVFGAGAAELIQAVCFAFIAPNDSVLIATPAFGEYARASALCGAAIAVAPLSSDPGDRTAFVDRVIAVRPRIVFVGAPISPTGEQLEHDTLCVLADVCASVDALLVLDQSYDAFADRPVGFPALPGHAAVAHLRSLTKEQAIAGVRVAFAIAPAAIAEWIDLVRAPWSASSIAQAAGAAALCDDAQTHVTRTTALLRAERARVAAACEHLGLATSESCTHYVTIDVADGAAARTRLITHGILVRDCASFGMPRRIRVAARTPEANDALIAALESITTLRNSS